MKKSRILKKKKKLIFKPKIENLQKNKLILEMIKILRKIDIIKNRIFSICLSTDYLTGNIFPKFRKLHKSRVAAIRVMIEAMLYYLNGKTGIVQASISKLADECGLSTISKSGNKSITRASRLISEFMEPMGFVRCRKNFSKKISLNPIFFTIFETFKLKKNQENPFLKILKSK